MILGLVLTIFLYVMAAAIFRLIVPFSKRAGLAWLIVTGSLLLAATNLALVLHLAAVVGWGLIVYAVARAIPRHARGISWLIFLGLIPANLLPTLVPDAFLTFGWWTPRFNNVTWTVGSAFFVIRTFVSVREALQEGRISWLPMLAGLTFVPAFSAGPIFGSMPFRPEKIAGKLPIRGIAEALMKLGWGAAAFYVVAPYLRGLIVGKTLVSEIAGTYLGLAALYFDFSGYTLMAIGLAALCGVTLPENFNRPYLATNIREFWQRWHMSLSWFVSTYLYKPFVRQWGKPRLGIFLAFTAVGIWHELSIGYLLWGIGHGAALSLAMKPPQVWTRMHAAMPRPVSFAISWVLTITWVAALSRIANAV